MYKRYECSSIKLPDDIQNKVIDKIYVLNEPSIDKLNEVCGVVGYPEGVIKHGYYIETSFITYILIIFTDGTYIHTHIVEPVENHCADVDHYDVEHGSSSCRNSGIEKLKGETILDIETTETFLYYDTDDLEDYHWIVVDICTKDTKVSAMLIVPWV